MGPCGCANPKLRQQATFVFSTYFSRLLYLGLKTEDVCPTDLQTTDSPKDEPSEQVLNEVEWWAKGTVGEAWAVGSGQWASAP